jgi:RNA polymerase sigma factor (sigma-70 family)
MADAATVVGDAARQHACYLWGLCYRMTGCAADADDLVQETYLRALERPPERLDVPLRPWLASVAVHLSVDHLRRRRRTPYRGFWLPSPIETGEEALPSAEPMLPDGSSAEGRYDLLESVSIAFLLALEALTPRQRAVLLLRDVFDYSARETAECLGISEDNVKTLLLRARRAMAAYDARRCRVTAETRGRAGEQLQAFLSRLTERDTAGLEALLAKDVRMLSDGGGQYHAANVPLLGPRRATTFLIRLLELRGPPDGAEVRELNGFPAIVAWYDEAPPKEAPRFTLSLRVGDDGRIEEVYSSLATRKLTALRFPAGPPAGG